MRLFLALIALTLASADARNLKSAKGGDTEVTKSGNLKGTKAGKAGKGTKAPAKVTKAPKKGAKKGGDKKKCPKQSYSEQNTGMHLLVYSIRILMNFLFYRFHHSQQPILCITGPKPNDNSERLLHREGVIDEIPPSLCTNAADGKNVMLVVGDGMVRLYLELFNTSSI